MDNQTLFHGSNQEIRKITPYGVFGGIFGTPSESAARSHGAVVHQITSPRPLSDYALNYDPELGAWKHALELAGGDERTADSIMTPECADDDGERGWELQRLRGQLAQKLGYTSVEMKDEHGATWLCLPGCDIARI